MSYYLQNRTKTRIANATLTSASGALDEIIAAQAGWSISVTQFIVTNQKDELRPIAFYEGNSRITPDMNIAASGTLFLDLDGEQLELTKGSGLFAAANSNYLWPSETQVTVYYVLHDGRTPVTKSAARAASLKPIGNNAAIATPNKSGGQAEG